MSATLVIGAPLQGWVAPLRDVPDPVFAQLMVGDGLAIDPVGNTVVAPCDGIVSNVHAARHALTLRTGNGVEVLIHLGVDSVALKGEGIAALVEADAAVKAGQVLLRFDLDLLVLRARAAVTPVIVANTGRFEVEPLASGLVAPGDPLFRVVEKAERARGADSGGRTLQRTMQVRLPYGIHVRPAARLADLSRRHAVEAVVRLGDSRAPMSSPLAVMRLGVAQGASVTIDASGANAEAALDAFEHVLSDTSVEETRAAGAARLVPESTPVSERRLRGIPAAPGIATGTAFRLSPAETAIADAVEWKDAAAEKARLDSALAEARTALAREAAMPGPSGAVLAAQLAFLDDPLLLEDAHAGVETGRGAGAAWREAIKTQAEALLKLGDARMAERVEDLRDIEARVIARLARAPDQIVAAPADSILLARALLPSQVAALDPANIKGIALMEGGPTSHAAILAAGMGIPMGVAFGSELQTIPDGALLALDADGGVLEVEPGPRRVAKVQSIRARRAETAKSLRNWQCRSADGVRIEVFANLGSAADAHAAVEAGAEGCGLLRTEFLFFDRACAPDEAEQREHYQAIADILGPRPLTVRLLDIGGDKPAPYLRMAAEENPALGLRGVRVSLARPALLETQLRAIQSVKSQGGVRVMVPMVASLAEIEAVADVAARIAAGLGLPCSFDIGAMVETPAAAVTTELLCRRAAFVSIGSNDLTQYALAMDRGNAAVAAGVDGLHPAVLRMIAAASEGARQSARSVGVCGDLAADRLAAPILLGLGVTQLSAPPASIPALKATVASLRVEACRAFVAEALDLESAAAVRARAVEFLEGYAS